MNLKLIFFFVFVCHLTSEITARRRSTEFITKVDFSNYENKSERELVDDTNVNWVRTDAENAYVCQGTRIKTDPNLLRLLPAKGKFMITYPYVRPKLGQTLTGEFITDELSLPTSKANLNFSYSQDRGTTLRVFMSGSDEQSGWKEVWENFASSKTNGVVWGQAQLSGLMGSFYLIFQAEVEAVKDYQYSFRTYLSQVVVDHVELKSLR